MSANNRLICFDFFSELNQVAPEIPESLGSFICKCPSWWILNSRLQDQATDSVTVHVWFLYITWNIVDVSIISTNPSPTKQPLRNHGLVGDLHLYGYMDLYNIYIYTYIHIIYIYTYIGIYGTLYCRGVSISQGDGIPPVVVGPSMAVPWHIWKQHDQVLDGTIRLELDMTSQFLGHQKTLSLGFLWSIFRGW